LKLKTMHSNLSRNKQRGIRFVTCKRQVPGRLRCVDAEFVMHPYIRKKSPPKHFIQVDRI
jgi:hypothetical protein